MNNLNEQNENIEDRIKSIISKKLKNNDFKNELDSDKIEIIEKLFEIFPDLKDKKKFFNNINTNIHKKIKKNILEKSNSDEIILDEIIFNDKIIYTDKFNAIWNENAELIGIIKKNDSDISYHFFDKDYNININLQEIINL